MDAKDFEKLKKLKGFQMLPTTASSDAEWINWMKALDSSFDRGTSVQMFMELWHRRGTSAARTLNLRQYMKQHYKVDLGEGLGDKIVDLGGGVIDTVSGVFKMGKTVFFITLGGAVILFGAIVYTVVKNPGAIAKAAIA